MTRKREPRPVPRLALGLVLLIGAGGGPYSRPVDPDFPWQWSLENRGQPVHRGSDKRGTPDADIDGVEAFAAGHSGRGVVLALLGLLEGQERTLARLEEVGRRVRCIERSGR